MSHTEPTYMCLAGIGVTHSIAPPMHNFIANSLGKPWTFYASEFPTVEAMMQRLREPDFAGAVVTMPFKQTCMQHLDGVDDVGRRIGAVNNIYRSKDNKLRGTNTDWRGIKGCLVEASEEGKGKTAMIIGAGGASRAAVYALYVELGCNTIYVINRDVQEVENLFKDAQAYLDGESKLKLIHVTSVSQAKQLTTPFYIVGTVPDFEPQTTEEKEMREMLRIFLDTKTEADKGVVLDMCFKPRNTRILKLGRSLGWQCVDGTGVIGHQIEEQWRLWAGVTEIPKEEAWKVLKKAAEESTAINF